MTRFRLGILVAPALLVAGCAGQQAPVVATPIGQRVPADILVCADEPASKRVRTDRDAARYVVDLAAAGRDCRTKLGAAKSILDGEK